MSGSVPVPSRGEWAVHISNQWPAVFRPSQHSWTDFTFVRLEIEHERCMYNWNATIGVLGLVFYVVYSYREGKPKSPSEEIVERLQADHPGIKVEDPFGVLAEIDKEAERRDRP